MSQNQDIFDFDVDVFQSAQHKSPPHQQYKPVSPPPQQQIKPPSKQSISQPIMTHSNKQKPKKVVNRFSLTDQQKINIAKRLPRGFVLLKKGDYPTQDHQGSFKGQIQYVPQKRDPKIASQQLLQKLPMAVLNTLNPKKDMDKRAQKPGLRLSTGQLPQGKSKQTQKVKGVLQKFRKHPKYPQLAQQLNKLGLMQGFSQIQAQIKKNIHTIDSFKDRCLYILNSAKSATFAQTTIEIINELIDEFMFQIEQAKKLEFQNNLLMIQKNIDKITRQITDIRESGNWYLRKKKRTQRNFDQKQVMYIADLVRNLPPAYLVGVWQIVQQRPFLQSQQKQLQINFSQLKQKKIRQIQSYVKRKHNTYLTSRQRKKQKISRKQQQEVERRLNKNQEQKEKKQEIKEQKMQQQVQQKQNIMDMDNDLESFMNVVEIGDSNKKETYDIRDREENSINKYNNNKDDHVDFLQLDQLFEPQSKLIPKYQQQKVPPTPRFSSLDNNPYNDQQLKGNGQVKSKIKIDENQIQQQKQIKQFQMEQPDLRIPQPIDGDSSDSSFITDDQDSDY